MMSRTTPVTKEALLRILDEKLDEKLKPIRLLVDGLKDSVNFLSDKFDVIMKRIQVVETRCNEVMIEDKCLKDEVLRLSTIVNQHSEEINNIVNVITLNNTLEGSVSRYLVAQKILTKIQMPWLLRSPL